MWVCNCVCVHCNIWATSSHPHQITINWLALCVELDSRMNESWYWITNLRMPAGGLLSCNFHNFYHFPIWKGNFFLFGMILLLTWLRESNTISGFYFFFIYFGNWCIKPYDVVKKLKIKRIWILWYMIWTVRLWVEWWRVVALLVGGWSLIISILPCE